LDSFYYFRGHQDYLRKQENHPFNDRTPSCHQERPNSTNFAILEASEGQLSLGKLYFQVLDVQRASGGSFWLIVTWENNNFKYFTPGTPQFIEFILFWGFQTVDWCI
jgi:hypothetical protein